MKTSPVYGLTALGIINALGNSREQVLENLLVGHSPGMVQRSEWIPEQTVWVGEVQGSLPELPLSQQQFNSRNNRLLLAALEQIREEVDELIVQFGRERIALVIGSSTSGILEGERALAQAGENGTAPADYDYRQQEIGAPGVFLADYLGLNGIAYTLSTACSSSAKVFSSARNLLQLDICDAVIVGGVDSLCKLTLNGFTALSSVSSGRCNPFSANRDGISIGEGAALFIMQKQAAELNLLGVGESSDAHHISAPHPEGEGAIAAMQAALADAGLAAEQISYLNLHGTATIKNDEMESIAVDSVLGKQLPCSSTKRLTGHTLGAAGATEIGLCWLLMSRLNCDAVLPKQQWDGCVDGQLVPINLLRTDQRLASTEAKKMMSNSFAFGGSNACVVIGEAG
ncbi:MAG: beta-ketoacyl-[acyl-carrier-protein] synthase family protein [Spongiibacteraceae bacterium]